jgi:hypothetical protein
MPRQSASYTRPRPQHVSFASNIHQLAEDSDESGAVEKLMCRVLPNRGVYSLRLGTHSPGLYGERSGLHTLHG